MGSCANNIAQLIVRGVFFSSELIQLFNSIVWGLRASNLEHAVVQH
jgi:hypothetical protein